jgi:membrane-bound serine protease (ClpP class)
LSLIALFAVSPLLAETRPAIVTTIDRDINPVTAEFLDEVVREAAEKNASVIVIQLNTPGGRLDSTRKITTSILASRVPVIGYVTPPGAQAASAGFLVLMACDVAAMAPGTNTGSASPVGGSGEELPLTISKKIKEDTAALVRSVTTARGRPNEPAVQAINEAISFSETEASDKTLIELVAKDLPDLLEKLDGRTVKRVGQPDSSLKTKGSTIVEKQMTPLQKALGVIASPAVAGLLMLLGLVGIYAELQNPGAIFPGILGGICLLLALFALSVLPTNWVGIGLVLLGLLFFFLEVKLTGHGLFALGGAISMVLGAALLFPKDDLAPRGEFWFVTGVAVAVSGILALLSFKALAVQRLPNRTGWDGMIGLTATARGEIDQEKGKVFVDGAIWEARSEAPIRAGDPVVVAGVEGLRLIVKPRS